MNSSYSLVVLNGATPGHTLRLDAELPNVTIGRHSARELPLDDSRASRLHAQVCYRAQRWHLEDCGSTNGTFVNSQPVKRTILEPGDLIRVADRLILFTSNSDESSELFANSGVRATTLIGRLPGTNRQGEVVQSSLGNSMTQVVRDSAVLCRLATQLHKHATIELMIEDAMNALIDGVDPDCVLIWLVGTDGRLRCAAQWGNLELAGGDSHVLASLAVEKDKAFLLRESTLPDSSSQMQECVGAAMGIPIPGQSSRRGAIECFRDPQRGLFARHALDFAIVVANQGGLALENLEHRERLEQANEELRRRLSSDSQLVGTSQAMQDVLDQIARVGPTAATVLILGESGTGKELVAQSIHELSAQRSGPYIAVNCAAFSDTLLESELFGHEPGSFTGADRRRIGQFERAHRGTIFLDEIGEMSLACQAKLLRLLEGHPFERVGGQESIRVDVRVVAATHRDLEERVAQGHFREDLYYRLRVIDMLLPPLRERGHDAVDLASRFLDRYHQKVGRGPRRFSTEAIAAIQAYSWPGNVRELKNAVERAVVLGRGDEVTVADLGIAHKQEVAGLATEPLSLREAERRHIQFVLNQVGGNKTQACKILGIGRATLYSKLSDPAGEPSSEE